MTEVEIVTVVYSELLKVLGGAAFVLAALSAFLGKVWINRIANREAQVREERIAEVRASFEQQNDSIRAQLNVAVERTVFVDKLQFEHEYAIYKQAWECLYALRQATLRMRPIMDYVDPKEPKEDRMLSRMNAFVEPFNAYRDLIEKSKPFYAEEVYKALLSVRDECHSERIDYEYTERSNREYYSEARKNHAAILTSIEAACQAIRNRVAEVRVT